MGGVRTAQSFHRLPLSWAQPERNGVRLATSLSLPDGHDLPKPVTLPSSIPICANYFASNPRRSRKSLDALRPFWHAGCQHYRVPECVAPQHRVAETQAFAGKGLRPMSSEALK